MHSGPAWGLKDSWSSDAGYLNPCTHKRRYRDYPTRGVRDKGSPTLDILLGEQPFGQ